MLAPHWRDDARGTLVGLTLAHDRRHVSRAVLEGIAFQCKEVVDAMVADTAADGAAGVDLAGLRVDGGVSLSNELLQCQADLLSVAVERPANVETTASGAAIAAGIGAGVWSSPDELAGGDDVERSFAPAIDDAERAQRCAKWDQAVQCSLNWA